MKPTISTVVAVLFSFTVLAYPALTTTIHIPADQPTIQAGIDASVDGGLVLVAPGTYWEKIDFLGKAITVMSVAGADVTVIDGGYCQSPFPPLTEECINCAVVTFSGGETENSVIDGFTIRNGQGKVCIHPLC